MVPGQGLWARVIGSVWVLCGVLVCCEGCVIIGTVGLEMRQWHLDFGTQRAGSVTCGRPGAAEVCGGICALWYFGNHPTYLGHVPRWIDDYAADGVGRL